MTTPDNIKAASIVQHFWESGVTLIGFIALFWWDGGPVELKIVLGLILVRVCFSWSELSMLEKQISSMALENQKQIAMLHGFLFEIGRKLEKTGPDADSVESEKEAALRFLEKMENAERSFQESYERSANVARIMSPSVGSLAWSSIIGSVVQVGVLVLIAWGLSEWIKSI